MGLIENDQIIGQHRRLLQASKQALTGQRINATISRSLPSSQKGWPARASLSVTMRNSSQNGQGRFMWKPKRKQEGKKKEKGNRSRKSKRPPRLTFPLPLQQHPLSPGWAQLANSTTVLTSTTAEVALNDLSQEVAPILGLPCTAALGRLVAQYRTSPGLSFA
jgi:hypothetical protein